LLTSQNLFADASKSFKRGRYTDALTALNRLLDVSRDARTYKLLARTLLALGYREEAARTYILAGELGGENADDFFIDAMKLYIELGLNDAALSLGLPLLDRAQRDADLAFMIADLFWKRGEKEIVRAFLPVLASSSNSKHNSLAFLLLSGSATNKSDREALAALLGRMPKALPILMAHLVTQREVNAYHEVERLRPQIKRIMATNLEKLQRIDAPFYNLTWMDNEALNKNVGYVPELYPAENPTVRHSAPHNWGDKIRIGYLSSDIWLHHATMKLFSAVLEAHNSQRFEVTLFCYTASKHPKHDDETRARWGKVVSILDMTDEQAARTIREHGIDILIDMKGHTREGRAAILNHKTAPVQVAWLGFPGTTVNTDLDYIIGDHWVLPEKSKPHYWEKFCRLPESYQPNNPYQPEADANMFTRADAKLPEDAFVFASFNATRKISTETIELWGRILNATPDSMIWIMINSPESEENIRRKFASLRIKAERVVFTKMMPYEAHLSRITLADVGLDTFPYNGHTTTSEQLWSGLPVITKVGTHFASRVTESLLRAIDLPELIADDEDGYFRSAVALYENRQVVAEYKERLQQNRYVKPLFDSERFCRHLETAYEMMAARAKQGLAPDHIDVPALPPREGKFR